MAAFETGWGSRPILRWTTAVGLACVGFLSSAPAQCPIQLNDITKETGITFKHMDGSSGRYYIMETVSAGLALFDYDGDGDVDIYFLNGSPLPGKKFKVSPRNALYRNDGKWKFTDVTGKAGVGDTGYGLGVAVADYDNDGDPDIYLNNYGPNVMYRNTGNGKFVDVSDECGDGLKVNLSSRGAGFDDLDNDGDIDVVILNSRREPTILRNDSATENHWIQIRLQGVKTNRDGVGARVKVVAGDLTQIDEVHSGRGYQSHYGTRLHFGLGKRDRIDRVEVRWIGGGVDVVRNVEVDQVLSITEQNDL
jgi:hypothetical protein